MDDPIFKAKYQKYKYKVKLWEKQFKEKNGRIPSKHDIREAPTSIKDAYKLYYKLKTSFLEETLSDALEDDSFDLSILESSSQMDTGTMDLSQLTHSNITSTCGNSVILSDCDSTKLQESRLSEADQSHELSLTTSNRSNIFEAEIFDKINENAWAAEIGTKAANGSTNDKQAELGTKVRATMSDKLFRNSSFSKRNPRKSLSRNNLQSSNSFSSYSGGSQRELLPDLETILSQKSQQAKENENELAATVAVGNPVITGNLKTVHSTLDNEFNLEWLNRCNQTNSLETDSMDLRASISSQQHSDKSADVKPSYGLSNINTTALARVEAAAMSSKKTEAEAHAPHADVSPVEYKNDCSQVQIVTENKYSYSDEDDDEIANSEDDNNISPTAPQIRSIRHVLKKRKLENVDNPSEAEAVLNVKENTPTIETNKPAVVNRNIEEPSKMVKQKKTKKVVVKRTRTAAPVARRRSARVPKARQDNVKQYEMSSDSGDGNEDDPFGGDDSDADPDFDIDKKLPLKQMQNDEFDDILNAEDEEDNETEPTQKRVVKRKLVKVVKVAKVPAKKVIKAAKKSTVPKSVKDKKAPNTAENDEEIEETPYDYKMEFGLDTLKSVPRIAIDELEKSTQAFSDYVNKQTAMPMIAKGAPKASRTAPVTKQSIAREKLEQKMAAGTQNENFVRINLRKKVFVRGKKTINFSRYKKTQWRQKKAAALTGPEMDMGGCDGGFLVCFQCGQTGHFAQNCKIKSDRLLPLNADVEDSPFPTLEEIEQMADEKRQAVHTNKNTPTISNPTWKADTEDGSSDENIVLDDETDVINAVEEKEAPEVVILKTVAAPTYIGHSIPEDFLKKAGLLDDSQDDGPNVKPLYKLHNGTIRETPQEVFDALNMFGHTQFRPGQEKAVMRILSGQSSLVTLSTGSGKSLCYQLPAYLYSKYQKCITLVVSPLVSLMEDQVHGVPSFLNAQCLHTNQNKEKRERTIAMIKSGIVHVLLVSPEAIVAGEKSSGFGSILRDLPPIAFVCIDEAHCVSQWSHNFRPSYLMVCRVLHETLKVQTILGLTATATLATRQSIVKHLIIPDGLSGVISDIPLPDNLTLSISCDENRDFGLIRLLKHERFANFQSIIIYCTRRDECENVAKNLRTIFQDTMHEKTDTKKRKRGFQSNVEPYHAGMPASRRKSIQNKFMRGDLKIVVATIAFGMGINKADIRAVIHYNMPNNFERYVQEVGRAGRDGKLAHCHLFLDAKGSDKLELRRHIYANSIDRHIIRKLLQKVFIPCACVKNLKRPEVASSYQADLDTVQNMSWTDDMNDPVVEKVIKTRVCPGHEVCFSVEATVAELDIPEENIATLLCYLELHEQRFIKILSKAYTMCKVLSYGGPKELRTAAQSCPPLAMAIALDLKRGKSHETSTFIEFPVIDIASAIGWNSGVVKYQLKNLEWTTLNGLPKRSTISVEFSDLGFRVRAPGDLSDDELDSTLDVLYSRVQGQEKTQLRQLENVFNGLTSVSRKSCVSCANIDANDVNSEKLKHLIREYFQSDESHAEFELEQSQPTDDAASDRDIITDIRTMIVRYPENSFTGRSLARIFHGVSSPVYPAVIWGRCKYWRAHIKTDFNRIVTSANKEIIKMRT